MQLLSSLACLLGIPPALPSHQLLLMEVWKVPSGALLAQTDSATGLTPSGKPRLLLLLLPALLLLTCPAAQLARLGRLLPGGTLEAAAGGCKESSGQMRSAPSLLLLPAAGSFLL